MCRTWIHNTEWETQVSKSSEEKSFFIFIPARKHTLWSLWWVQNLSRGFQAVRNREWRVRNRTGSGELETESHLTWKGQRSQPSLTSLWIFLLVLWKIQRCCNQTDTWIWTPALSHHATFGKALILFESHFNYMTNSTEVTNKWDAVRMRRKGHWIESLESKSGY